MEFRICTKYIEQCIKSVINQKNVKIEHIIIDGLSTDNTLNIVRKYKNIKFISEQDSGEVDALNKGLKLAKGNYICWLNADDWLEPNVLQLINNLDNKIELQPCLILFEISAKLCADPIISNFDFLKLR